MSTDELILDALSSITHTCWGIIVIMLILSVIFVIALVRAQNKIDNIILVLTPEQRKYYRHLTYSKRKKLKTIDIPKVEPIRWAVTKERYEPKRYS